MTATVKRERSSNWSLAEITILTDFVEKNEEVLKAKQSNLITNAKKNSKWAEVTDLVNAVGVQRRSVEQVKFKWGNLQQRAKKSFTEARKHARKTGGGPPIKPPTATEEKIIDLMKDRPNFSGIAGGFESSMPTTSGTVYYTKFYVYSFPYNVVIKISQHIYRLIDCLHCWLAVRTDIDDVIL